VPGRERSDGLKVIANQGESKGEMFGGTTARTYIGFLDNYSGDKPFFLNVGFNNGCV